MGGANNTNSAQQQGTGNKGGGWNSGARQDDGVVVEARLRRGRGRRRRARRDKSGTPPHRTRPLTRPARAPRPSPRRPRCRHPHGPLFDGEADRLEPPPACHSERRVDCARNQQDTKVPTASMITMTRRLRSRRGDRAGASGRLRRAAVVMALGRVAAVERTAVHTLTRRRAAVAAVAGAGVGRRGQCREVTVAGRRALVDVEERVVYGAWGQPSHSQPVQSQP